METDTHTHTHTDTHTDTHRPSTVTLAAHARRGLIIIMCLQNWELISASKSGDVMTVVSLLNSGADVQTENEVYIHFL